MMKGSNLKTTKILLRVWMGLTSLVVFAASWIALAHAPKPNQFKASDIPAMPALPPVPSIGQRQSFDEDSGPRLTARQPTIRLRTGGS
jgi:hypothetical protein